MKFPNIKIYTKHFKEKYRNLKSRNRFINNEKNPFIKECQKATRRFKKRSTT